MTSLFTEKDTEANDLKTHTQIFLFLQIITKKISIKAFPFECNPCNLTQHRTKTPNNVENMFVWLAFNWKLVVEIKWDKTCEMPSFVPGTY